MSMDAPAARPSALDALEVPLIAAPMAGGPSSPGLAIAVTRAGGLGMLAAGYQSAEALAEQIAAVRSGLRDVDRLFGVNVFVAESSPTDPQQLADFRSRWVQAVAALDAELGEQAAERPLPDYSDDGWDQKIALLVEDPVPVVSFTFGLPPAATIRALQDAGTTVLLSVSSSEEAVEAAAFGPDALVLQGPDAGGHRFTLAQDTAPGTTPLPELLEQTLAALASSHPQLPVIAAGGISFRADAARLLETGAHAVQVGTLFLAAEEAGTGAVHREAVLAAAGDPSSAQTVVTRAFSGRPARALSTPFTEAMAEHEIAGYPQVNSLTSPIRKAAAAAGKRELVHLWAGTGFPACRARPAAEIVESFRGL